MANVKEPEPGTRGHRIDQLRIALKMTRGEFGDALKDVAEDEGLDGAGKWDLSRVSRTILSRKPIPLDDMAAIVRLAHSRGFRDVTWDWLVFGDVSKAAERDLFKKVAG